MSIRHISPQLRRELPPDPILFGTTSAMAAIRRSLLKVADTNIPVLVEGESGTGKEIICRYLHQHSIWGRRPFVKVNCPAVAGTLLESELFGYQRGALEQATSPELPVRGSLFFDEICDLAPVLQSRLLHVLQDGRFPGIGSDAGHALNVRVICSSNRPLRPEIAAERFREDLYYCITGLVLRLPPLRERLGDLRMLSDYFVALYNERFERRVAEVSESSLAVMACHRWTGNIRELENLIKRYVVLGTEDAIVGEIRQGGLAGTAGIPSAAASLGEQTRAAMHEVEGRIILDALRANQWNRKRTARSLNISYRSLLYKLKKSGIANFRQVRMEKTQWNTLRDLQ